MRLTCPACGAVASLEAWALDEDARHTLATLLELGEPASAALKYLALFRTPGSKRGLAWSKVRRLAEQLRDLVKDQGIQWDGRRILANKPAWWSEALAVVLEREAQGKLNKPLTNHNLLRTIAYGAADKASEAALRDKEQGLRHPASAGQARAATGAPSAPQGPAVSREAGAAHVGAILDGLRGQGSKS